MRVMAREMNALKKTIKRVVHDHLGVKSRARKQILFPTKRFKALRLQKSLDSHEKNASNSVGPLAHQT